MPATEPPQSPSPTMRCGWLCFSPQWLQKLHTSLALVVTLFSVAIVQGLVVNGLIPSSLSTLERRFDLQSYQTGLLSAMYDIGCLVAIIPVSYYGGIGHKGRWLGWGIVLLGVGSVIFTLPQFISEDYEIGEEESYMCNRDGTDDSSDCTDDKMSVGYYLLFLLAQFIHGAGAAGLFSLGFSYVDENVMPNRSAVATGALFTAAALGPAFGYLIAGVFLSIYGDIDTVDSDTIDLDTDDPRWYGAWWIGFLLAACLAFITGFCLLGFAKEIPGSKEKQALKANEADKRCCREVIEQPGFGTEARDIPATLKHLTLNPTYMFFMLGGALDNFLLNGFITFFPKLMEHQFALTASQAAFYAGLIGVIGIVVGCLGCSILMSVFNMSCVQIIRACLALSVVSSLGFFGFIFSCTAPTYVGVVHSYNSSSKLSSVNLTSECNSGCGCDLDSYEPVCVDDSKLYFSPCHAGCTVGYLNDTYSSCSCLPALSDVMHLSSEEQCQPSCSTFAIFLFFIFILVAGTLAGDTTLIQISLRVVPFSQRSMALGFGWVFGRLIGTIPGPIVLGAVIDRSCELWGEECGSRTSCLAYDNDEMKRNFVMVPALLRVVVIVLMVFGWWMYKPDSTAEAQQQQKNQQNQHGHDDENHTEQANTNLGYEGSRF